MIPGAMVAPAPSTKAVSQCGGMKGLGSKTEMGGKTVCSKKFCCNNSLKKGKKNAQKAYLIVFMFHFFSL